MADSYAQAKAVLKLANDQVREIAPAASVGIGRVGDDFVIKVLLEDELEPGLKLPLTIEEVSVVAQIAGRTIAHTTTP